MLALSFVATALLYLTLVSAVGARFAPGYVLPDPAVVVVVFLALRREPVVVAGTALAIGYLAGRQAAAPLGLHETVLLSIAVLAYVASGRLAASGALYFAAVCGLMTVLSQLLTALLLWWGLGRVGFSSGATALLIPQAAATCLFALLTHRSLRWLDRRYGDEPHKGLPWS